MPLLYRSVSAGEPSTVPPTPSAVAMVILDWSPVSTSAVIRTPDFSDETDTARITTIEKNLKIREAEIAKYKSKLYEGITSYIPRDRVSLVVDVQMNFDVEKEKRTELLPVVLKEDDPATPYDDGERKYSLTISQKRAKETFTGPNWIPEGPPGFDPNVPPAYKGALEQRAR